MTFNHRDICSNGHFADARRYRAALLASVAAVMFAAFAAPARAQVEEIVVTARKSEESDRNIPVAMTTLSEKQLKTFDLSSLEKIAANTPSLTVVRGTSGSGADISMRGIGSNFLSIAIEQSVAVNVDGVYFGQGRVINEAMFDLARVEILKGPQALFFGKNATAGAVSFTTNGPGDRFEAMARASYEFRSNEPGLEAMLSGPVNDQLGLRLAVKWSGMAGGLVRNITPAATYTTFDIANAFAAANHVVPAPRTRLPAEKNLAARATAKFAPSSDFSLTLKGAFDRYRSDSATWNEELVFCPTGQPQKAPGQECRGDWRVHQNDMPRDIAATNPLMNRHGGRLYQDYNSSSIAADAQYNTEAVSLTWVTGFHRFTNRFLGDYDDTDTTTGQVWGAERSTYKAFSTELRARSRFEGPVNFMAGVYYDATKMGFDQDVVFPGGVENSAAVDRSTRYVTLRKFGETDGSTAAAFGQLIWDVMPKWQFTGGARYTRETKDSVFRQPYVVAAFQGAFLQFNPADPRTAFGQRQEFNNLSPEATLTWKPQEDLTVYGAYKTGYKSGGFSISSIATVATVLSDLAFAPEKVKGGEVGLKSVLFDRALRLDLVAFDYRYSNLQVDFFDSPNLRSYTFNAGSARTRGVELEFNWRPPQVRGFALSGAATYNDAKYTRFPFAPCYGGQTPAEGCRPTLLPNGTTSMRQDIAGKATGLAPKWVASLQADYNTKIGESLTFGATGAVRYSSSYNSTSIGTPFARQPGYATLDANLRLGSADGLWELSVIARNLTNKYAVLASYDASGTGSGTGTAAGVRSDQTGFMNSPRTVMVQLTLRR